MTEFDPQADAAACYEVAIAAIREVNIRSGKVQPATEHELRQAEQGAVPVSELDVAQPKVRDTTGANANICGRAGEHLVCAEFLAHGYECWIVEGKAQYDLLADVRGKILRIQVKTTAGVKACPQRRNHTPVYMWNARKYGKGGRQSYAKGDADIIAYVALDRRQVAYLPADRVAQSVNMRLREFADQYVSQTGMFLDDFPLSKLIEKVAA